MEEKNYWQKRISRRRLLKYSGLAATGAGAAYIVGCGDDDDDDGGEATTPAASGTATAAATPTPAASEIKRGGTMKVFSPGAASLDPIIDPSGGQRFMLSAVYGTLLDYRADTFGDTEIVPGHAEEWEYADPTTLTLKLDPRITWSDEDPMNGRPFTAEDIAWNVDYKKTTSEATTWDIVESVDVVDDNTVTLHLSAPFAPFLSSLPGGVAGFLYPREVIERDGDMKNTAIGTGPMMLDSFEPTSLIRLKARPDYWKDGEDGDALPYLDGLEDTAVVEYQTRVARLQAGEFDQWYSQAGPNKIDAEALADAGMDVEETPFLNAKVLWMNMLDPIFEDERVRKAIHLLIDRQQIIDTVYDGAGYKTAWLDLPGWGWDDATVAAALERNVEDAVAMLSAAGVSDLSLELVGYTGAAAGSDPDVDAVIQQNLDDGGITVNLAIQPDYTTVLENYAKPGTFQIYVQHSGSGGDPDDFFRRRYLSTQSDTNNWARIKDTDLDALIEAQAQEVDPEARQEKVIAVQDYLYEKMYSAPTSAPLIFKPRWPRLHMSAQHFSSRAVRIDEAWLDSDA